MAKKTKSFSLHVNSIERKRKHDVAQELKQISKFAKDRDVRAYAFVMIDSDGLSHCVWDTGSIMPLWAFAPTIHECLSRDISESGVDETWKPPLPIKG